MGQRKIQRENGEHRKGKREKKEVSESTLEKIKVPCGEKRGWKRTREGRDNEWGEELTFEFSIDFKGFPVARGGGVET